MYRSNKNLFRILNVYFQNYCSRNQVYRFERSTDPPLLNLKSDLDHGRKYRFWVKVPVAVKRPLALQKLHHSFTIVNKSFKTLNSQIEIISQFYLGFKSNFCENWKGKSSELYKWYEPFHFLGIISAAFNETLRSLNFCTGFCYRRDSRKMAFFTHLHYGHLQNNDACQCS